MYIKVDSRESELLKQIQQLILFIPIYKNLKVVTENLPIGDIIIADDNEDKIIIERKSINDLLASIKDGRYEEQSYRLNGLKIHNHNIYYMIEGDINKINRFKETKFERTSVYSAIFSLNYYKGFSVMRTFSLEESALFICNTANKLQKYSALNKKAFYQSLIEKKSKMVENKIDNEDDNIVNSIIDNIKNNNQQQEPKQDTEMEIDVDAEIGPEPSDKDYINVVKKVKKDNITISNIDEIMLCQIPSISSLTAISIMDKFKTFPNLIKELENDTNCLNNITFTNSTRKISKTSITNIIKFLLKK